MNILDYVFGKKQTEELEKYSYQIVNGNKNNNFGISNYKIFENPAARSAVHTFASLCTKLSTEVNGAARTDLKNIIKHNPAPLLDLPKFLYRTATILSLNNAVFIVPVEDIDGWVVGYEPLAPADVTAVDFGGQIYLRITTNDGKVLGIEYSKAGIITNFDDGKGLFGSDNKAILNLLELYGVNVRSNIETAKNNTGLRFLGKLKNIIKPDDLTKRKQVFDEINLKKSGGIAIYDNSFEDLVQIKPNETVFNAPQIRLIDEQIYAYFGVPPNIISGKANSEEQKAFFSLKIEPFAIKLSSALTNMTFSEREKAMGNEIRFYVDDFSIISASEKSEIIGRLADRGIFTMNEIRKMLELPPVENGDFFIRRLEYSGGL